MVVSLITAAVVYLPVLIIPAAELWLLILAALLVLLLLQQCILRYQQPDLTSSINQAIVPTTACYLVITHCTVNIMAPISINTTKCNITRTKYIHLH